MLIYCVVVDDVVGDNSWYLTCIPAHADITYPHSINPYNAYCVNILLLMIDNIMLYLGVLITFSNTRQITPTTIQITNMTNCMLQFYKNNCDNFSVWSCWE